MKLSVKFLVGIGGEVFAYFPTERYDNSEVGSKVLFMSYSHVGQHSSCHVDYANRCKEAIHRQYHVLLRELVTQVGYRNLHVMNSELIKCWRNPTKREIAFGEGAIHYRDFTVALIGINEKGWIKSWFISKDDGLRYNHY